MTERPESQISESQIAVHWREDYAFAEGEELELERAGFLIQVSECVGKRDQDLTELLEKRPKDGKEGLSKNQTISAQLRKLPPAPPNRSPITEPLQTSTSHLHKLLPALVRTVIGPGSEAIHGFEVG